jgi:SAM-dependent methyltransferase
MSSRPGWSNLVTESPEWTWRDERLFQAGISPNVAPNSNPSALHRLVVRYCYARHNNSPKVQRTIKSLLAELTPGDWGLNLGSGDTSLHPQMINLDVNPASSVNVVVNSQILPFKDNSLKLVVSQEVIEHLPDPPCTIREVLRVLTPGGKFYCQAPFIIGYHPGPTDFWRFTREGMAQLFAAPQWRVVDLETAVGHGTGAYRIAVEAFAVSLSLVSGFLYKPAKGCAALLFSPFKLFDLVSDATPERDRIPGGYFCVAEKVSQPQ